MVHAEQLIMYRAYIGGIIAFGVITVAVPPAAFAQCEAGRTHRPVEDLFASDVVYLQERGEVQLEVKPARTQERGVRSTVLEADIEYGPRDWWQIQTEWEVREWTHPSDGTPTSEVGDIAVGTRLGWRCLRGSRYHLSVGVDVSMPAGMLQDIPEATRHVGLAPSVIVAREVARTAHVFSALEVDARLNHHEADIGDWTYTSDTGMFLRIVRGFRLTTELLVEGGPGEDRDVHFLPGILWHRGDVIEIGVGVLAPLSHNAARGVLAHVVCELGGSHDGK